MLKNMGTLYKTKKLMEMLFSSLFLFINLTKIDPAQVFGELYRYKKGEKTQSNTHT